MDSLIDHVRSNIDVTKYFNDELPGIHWPATSEARTDCIFHPDKNTPSLSINAETGKFFCHGCGTGGKSTVSFHAKRYELSLVDAARLLFAKYLHPVIPDKLVRRWHRKLKETPSVLRYLKKERFLKQAVIEHMQLGWNGFRIIIPIRNEFGLCVNAKMFDPLVSKGLRKGKYAIKMLNYQSDGEERSYGSPPMLYPISSVPEEKEEWLFVCSGELDTLVLIGLDLSAVTSTAGEKSWPAQYNGLFHNRKIAVAYDNDEEGNRGVHKRVVPNLIKFARKIARVKVPRHIGKDVTDWVRDDERMRSHESWLRIAGKSKLLIENSPESMQSVVAQSVPLDEASDSKWFNQRIRVDALVTGKDSSPYILPKKFRVSCNKSCDTCPLAEFDHAFKEVSLEPSDPRVLRMVDVPEGTVQRNLLKIAGLGNSKPTCEAKADAIESFNLERLLLIPTLDSKGSQYVMRAAYHVGHGIRSNRAYSFEGTTTVDPQDQHSTHLFDIAKPVQDEIETFELSAELKEALKIFRPGKLGLLAHLMGIAEWQSRNVTKIRERPDLHIAVDLVFHSVRSFEFNRELVRRGMLDVLIIGDTRCGKGYVAEGLTRFYGLGEVASADNCSFAGLVGGVDSVNRRFMVKWGLIPLNNDRLVVIDEASSLTHEEISAMTRIRSEGVAEISKIVRESTKANTRLLWLSNTRDGQPIMEQGTGVRAIKNLMGANEDVSRFDFAVSVATDEVPSEVINDSAPFDMADLSRYSASLCRSHILWCWSRTTEQTHFSEEAVDRIIAESIRLGVEYSPKIPLIQAENIRIKLAKISAAIAARVFSTDESCHLVLVEENHVACACKFLRLIYNKPSMAYDMFSRTAIASARLEVNGEMVSIFQHMGKDKIYVINGLLETHKINLDVLSDFVGDIPTTKILIGDLVKQRCLSRIEGGGWYLKNAVFTHWLRAQRKELERAKSKRQTNRGE